jgi:hypothetical protein
MTNGQAVDDVRGEDAHVALCSTEKKGTGERPNKTKWTGDVKCEI